MGWWWREGGQESSAPGARIRDAPACSRSVRIRKSRRTRGHAVPLKELLRESDFVVLTCLLHDETRHLINAEALALMKTHRVS